MKGKFLKLALKLLHFAGIENEPVNATQRNYLFGRSSKFHLLCVIVGLHANIRFCVCCTKLCGSNQTAVFSYAHEFKYFMPTASRLSECSSVMAQSNSCTDPTEHG